MKIVGLQFGLRNIKTGISVFLCILISFVLQRETYVVSAITAIFTLREDQINTVKFGRHRIVGNIVGACTSVVCIGIFNLLGDSRLVQLFSIPLMIMLMIALLVKYDHAEGVVGASATLLTILFMIPKDASYLYALNRVVDSFIGMLIAVAINSLLPSIDPSAETN
ncbi:hypothetical protein NRIC_38200 [Enterococcus florum]|uniref:FUSC family protein n=1 Tax=Enterococcus florum TaxID=2480627 RepID=A0A4V0WQ30_9ENTE|nr:aromatic acid exporter family protein [Enterococcus florum]GCF95929.1 hypothetical protein NRIC_38200 [Enterococcus florum]